MVKGSVLVDMVKVVRQFKDPPWGQYLKPEDQELIQAMVIPTAWYPIESYMRIGMAVFKLIARGDPQAVIAFGRSGMDEMLEGPYRFHLERRDPFAAMQKFLDLRKSLFNFSRMEAKQTGEKSLCVRLSELGKFETGLEVFVLLAGAQFQRLVERNGGKNVRLETRIEPAPADNTLLFELSWE